MMIGTVTTATTMMVMMMLTAMITMIITQVVKKQCNRKEKCEIVPDNNRDGSVGSLGQFSSCKK